ncbi:hypothetical protein D3C78_770410 [compost metagenome]
MVEGQHLLLVQVQQRMFDGRLALLRRDIGTQLEVGVEQLVQFTEGGLHQQVLAAGAGRQLVEQEGQQGGGNGAAPVPLAGQLLPAAAVAQAQLEVVMVDLAQLEAAALLAVAVAILRQAVQQTQDVQRQEVGQAAGLAQAGAERRQVHVLPAALVGIRGLFAHLVEQCLLQLQRLLQPLGGSAGHGVAQVEGQLGVVLQQAEVFQLAQAAGDFLGGLPGEYHQLVGVDALVGLGGVEELQDGAELLQAPGRQVGQRQARFGLLLGQLEACRKHPRVVLLAAQEPAALQPGDGGGHLGFGVAVVGVEAGLHAVVLEDLAGGDDQLAALAPAAFRAQLGEDLLDVALAELRALAEAELGLDVLRVVEQHAACLLLVAAGAPGFLQVVLQRAGYVGVHHQAHVLLVHAHAEGVGGDDHP